MINIFNLFLFLFALWALLMIISSNVSWLYILCGILASSLISAAAFKFKIADKKSEFLYLSFGFYRYFLRMFLSNFFSSIKLILSMSLGSKPFNPIVYEIKFNKKNYFFNPALLMVSFNMTTGLLCIDLKEETILVYTIDEGFFKKFNLQKNCKILNNINDDDLV